LGWIYVSWDFLVSFTNDYEQDEQNQNQKKVVVKQSFGHQMPSLLEKKESRRFSLHVNYGMNKQGESLGHMTCCCEKQHLPSHAKKDPPADGSWSVDKGFC
jgi:hypothetical protein